MTNELNNSKNKTKRRPWPEKRRKAQAKRARDTKPWQHATGPRTKTGKQTSAKNSLKHGHRDQETCELLRLLRKQKQMLKSLRSDDN